MFRIGEAIEAEGRGGVARGWRRVRMGSSDSRARVCLAGDEKVLKPGGGAAGTAEG